MSAPAPVARWLAEPAGREVEALLARVAATEDVVRVAVMPDVHLAGEFCVGTVVATRGTLFPRAVGGDIGCGMAAVRLAAASDLLSSPREASRLLRGLPQLVPVRRHPARSAPDALPAALATAPLGDPVLEKWKTRDARFQLGTLGSGNHFLELQADEQERLWLVVHTGSRGIGRAIGERALERARSLPTGLHALDADSEEGRVYLQQVAWARAYAGENRRAILTAATELLDAMFGVGVEWQTLVTCDHNHVARERHGDDELWVHRKGALSAREGEAGIVPGSMGTASHHTSGRGCAAALCSSSHGAGRALPRGAARQAISLHRLRRELRGIHFSEHTADALRDEAPSAYKDIGKVMRAQRELTRIVRRLRPLLVYKGT